MGLQRTLRAACDGGVDGDCQVVQTLNPGLTQPYLILTDNGWTLGDDGESLLCPAHKPLVPVLDLKSYVGSELGADLVIAALDMVVADLIASEVSTRPTTSDEDWDRDDEEADVVADVYREVAARVANTFGLEVPA